MGFVRSSGDIGGREFERLEAAKFHDLGFMPVSWLLMEMIGAPAARGERVLARLEKHANYPGADSGYAVDDGPFDEGFEWTAQRLKKILVEHTGDVVGDPVARAEVHVQRQRRTGK